MLHYLRSLDQNSGKRKILRLVLVTIYLELS